MPNQSAPILVLLGFMGAGKSTLGRMLAQRLACPLVDLDDAIARAHGPIPEIFRTQGEAAFRQLERQQLERELTTLPRPSVLALGGGAFMQSANRELLARHQAATIFLDAPFDIICSRIAGTAQQRPLATDIDRLRTLYNERRPTYLLAQYTFDSDESNPSHLLTELVQLAVRLGIPAPARDTL